MSKEFQDELLKKLPTEPPAGLIDWWDKTHGSDRANAIVYRAAHIIHPATGLKEKMVECFCTCCKERYYLDYVPAAGCGKSYSPAPFGFRTAQGENIISGDDVICQECGAGCAVIHIGNCGYGRVIYEEYPLVFDVVDNCPVCFVWRYTRTVYKDGTLEIKCKPYEAYAFKGKSCYKFVGYQKSFCNIYYRSKWESRRRCDVTVAHWPKKDIYPYKTGIWDGTCLENCKVNRFIRDSSDSAVFLVAYLRSFQKYPHIENLVVSGMSRYINSAIKEDSYYGCAKIISRGIDFKEKKPSKMLGLMKTEFKEAVKSKWSYDDIGIYKLARDSRYPVKLSEFKEISKFLTLSSVKALAEKNRDISRIYRYLLSQQRKYPGHGACLFHLEDYWSMMRKLGLPLETLKDLYPQNIVVSHNRCVELINEQKEADFFKKEAAQRAAFERLTEEYADFSYEADGFCIFIAPQPTDLRNEGRSLSHCVGNYVNRHAEGRYLIFFLRRADVPEAAFYTVTLDAKELKITMNLGRCNCATTPEVREFSDKWLTYIKEIRRKQNEQGNKHHRSRECA